MMVTYSVHSQWVVVKDGFSSASFNQPMMVHPWFSILSVNYLSTLQFWWNRAVSHFLTCYDPWFLLQLNHSIKRCSQWCEHTRNHDHHQLSALAVVTAWPLSHLAPGGTALGLHLSQGLVGLMVDGCWVVARIGWLMVGECWWVVGFLLVTAVMVRAKRCFNRLGGYCIGRARNEAEAWSVNMVVLFEVCLF